MPGLGQAWPLTSSAPGLAPGEPAGSSTAALGGRVNQRSIAKCPRAWRVPGRQAGRQEERAAGPGTGCRCSCSALPPPPPISCLNPRWKRNIFPRLAPLPSRTDPGEEDGSGGCPQQLPCDGRPGWRPSPGPLGGCAPHPLPPVWCALPPELKAPAGGDATWSENGSWPAPLPPRGFQPPLPICFRQRETEPIHISEISCLKQLAAGKPLPVCFGNSQGKGVA